MKMQNYYRITFEDGQTVMVESESILTATREAIEIKTNTPEMYNTTKLKVISSNEA